MTKDKDPPARTEKRIAAEKKALKSAHRASKLKHHASPGCKKVVSKSLEERLGYYLTATEYDEKTNKPTVEGGLELLRNASRTTPSDERLAAVLEIPQTTFKRWLEKGRAEIYDPAFKKPKTVYGEFAQQVDRYRHAGIAQLENAAFQQALAGDGQLQRWLLERRDRAMYKIEETAPTVNIAAAPSEIAAAKQALEQYAVGKANAPPTETPPAAPEK